jgi:hypothetical protein
MPVKKCFKCGQSQPLENFYRHPQMADGHLGKCKGCAREDVKDNYQNRRPQYAEYYKSRDASQSRKDWRKTRSRSAEAQSRVAARWAVANAVRDGRIEQLPCRVCGDVNSEAHHADYSKPLVVDWLCFAHHREMHGQVVTASNSFTVPF